MNWFYNPWLIMFVLALIGAGLAALAVLGNALFPDFVRRARDLATQHPRRAFLIGLVNLLFFGLIALGLLTTRTVALRPLGVIVTTIVLTFLVVGASVIARWVGERLRPNDSSVTRQIVAGIVTLELAEVFPFVGWIVVPLLCLSLGLGAVILALFQRKPALTTTS